MKLFLFFLVRFILNSTSYRDLKNYFLHLQSLQPRHDPNLRGIRSPFHLNPISQTWANSQTIRCHETVLSTDTIFIRIWIFLPKNPLSNRIWFRERAGSALWDWMWLCWRRRSLDKWWSMLMKSILRLMDWEISIRWGLKGRVWLLRYTSFSIIFSVLHILSLHSSIDRYTFLSFGWNWEQFYFISILFSAAILVKYSKYNHKYLVLKFFFDHSKLFFCLCMIISSTLCECINQDMILASTTC